MTNGVLRHVPDAPSGPRFLILALLIPMILIAGIIWAQNESVRGEALRQQARVSYDRRFAAIQLVAELNDAETSQRGYVITGDPDFRDRYELARDEVVRRIDQLDRQFTDAPDQKKRIAQLREATGAKFTEMDDVVHLRDDVGMGPAGDRVRDGQGKQLMLRIRGLANDLVKAEVTIGDQRVSAFRQRSNSALRSIWALVALGSVALIGALILLWRRRSEMHRTNLAAFEAAERNQTILDSTIDALIILNPSGTVETLNAAAIRMLGYRPEDLLRRDVSMIADVAPGAGSFADRIGLIDGRLRTNWLTDRQVRHKDGRLIDVDISLGVMELPDGTHVVASLRDISERKRIERLKDDFISTVSHELRSPLTSIVGALRLLSGRNEGQLDAQGARLVQIAEENSRRLIRLINDMLDVDRMDSGKLRLNLRQTDMRDVIRRGCEGNQGLAEAFRATIHCEVPDAPLIAYCDEDRLIQALTNLTSNALKVTPRGGTVRITCVLDDATPRTIVRVDDEGPGVPQEFRKRIFGRFERALDDENKSGTGLGLAIAREIVSLHGGEIWFEDLPGGGTRFAFSLPVPNEARLADHIKAEPKILIVQADSDAAASMRTLLADEGYDCRVANLPDAARTAIRDNGLSLILVDSANPAFDALADASRLREEHRAEALAVMVTTEDARSDVDPLSTLKLIGWLDKPVQPPQLKTTVRSAIGHDDSRGRPCVLHLDDDSGTLEVTAAALKDDVSIFSATTLAGARELLRSHKLDLAIIDVDLAEGSGLELLADLVGTDGQSVPAIVYSAHDVSAQIGDDVDAVILKSGASMPHLKATIRRVIRSRKPRGKVQ